MNHDATQFTEDFGRDRAEERIEQLRDELERIEDENTRRLWASLIAMYERGWYDNIREDGHGY